MAIRLLSAAILVLAFLGPVQAAATRPVILSGATRTSHFLIRHDPKMQPTAEVIGQACEDWFTEISRRLELKSVPKSLIPVFLYRNQGEFARATGHNRPGQVLGRASSSGYVELDASGIFAPAEQVAGHEIVHVVIFRILGQQRDELPLWLNEGTAKYITNDLDTVDRSALADAVADGVLLSLSDIADRFPQGAQETLAYAQGTSAVMFFVKTHGERDLARLIHETARVGSFDVAMRNVTGESVEEFERSWRRSIEGRYGLPRLMRALSRFGFMAMVVIAIAAYAALRRRRRRLTEQYELEDANRRGVGE